MTPDLPPAGRVFVASLPPSALAADLAEQAARLARTHGGRPVPAARIHLTLRFLGSFDPLAADWLAQLAGRLGCVQGPAGVLRLERLGSFGHGRRHVGWLGPSVVPAALGALVARLDAVLSGLPGVRPDRRPFRPHVTLVRDARVAPNGVWAARSWPIDALVLMLSRLDRTEYQPLARVDLSDLDSPGT